MIIVSIILFLLIPSVFIIYIYKAEQKISQECSKLQLPTCQMQLLKLKLTSNEGETSERLTVVTQNARI